jgi:phytanoyl-CoA hydroxylase
MASVSALPLPPAPSYHSPEILTESPQIRSNHGSHIPGAGWLKPTSADTPIEEMRRRYEEDGYLYVNGLLPRKAVLDMREQQVLQLWNFL